MNRKQWSKNPLPRAFAQRIIKNDIEHLADEYQNSLPTLTTIQEKTRTIEEQSRLINWRKHKGASANQAMLIGRIGHKHIEQYLNGLNPPCPSPITKHWQHLRPILERVHNIRLVEGPLLHHYRGYSGRVDCVGEFYDLPQSVIEWKFSNSIKPIYDETKLQIAAYAGALNRQYGPPYNVNIKTGLIILVTPDGIDITYMDAQEMKKYWEMWLQKLNIFYGRLFDVA